MIDCKLCGKTYISISWSHFYYRHNKMTPAEYQLRFKGSVITGEKTREKHRRSLFGHASTDREPTPEEREAFQKWMKKNWKNPNFKKKWTKTRKDLWKDEARLAKHSKRMKKQWADPEYKAKISDSVKRVRNRPGFVAKQSRLFKKLWKDPDFRKKMAKRKPPPGAISRLAETQWQEVIGWLKKDPNDLGVKAVRLNLNHLSDLILKRWGISFVAKTIHYHLTKRGCSIIPIGPGEPADFSNVSLRYRKWIGPEI